MDAIECLKTRRCIRSYKPEAVSREIIEDIVDCGRLAATAINMQPWAFVAVTDPDVIDEIAATTVTGKFIADAPCCIAVFCEQGDYHMEDGSMATQNIMLAARAHGLASCCVGRDKNGFRDNVAEVLGVPPPYVLVSLIPIGYSDATSNPPKKALSEVLHWQKF